MSNRVGIRQILCLGGAHIGRMKTNWQCDSDGIIKKDSSGNSGKSKPKMEFSGLGDLNQAKGGKGERHPSRGTEVGKGMYAHTVQGGTWSEKPTSLESQAE